MKKNIFSRIALQSVIILLTNYIIIFEDGFLIHKNISALLLSALLIQFSIYFLGTLLFLQKQVNFKEAYYDMNLLGNCILVTLILLNNCLYSSTQKAVFYFSALIFVSLTIYSANKLKSSLTLVNEKI